MKKLFLLAAFIILTRCVAFAQITIAAKDAAQNVGKSVVVFDKVYTTGVDEGSGTAFLYLGRNYPDQYLTVVIKHQDRAKFTQEEPELYFKWVQVRVAGKIVLYKNRPAIIPTEAAQLQLDMRGRTIQLPGPKH